MSLGTVLGEIRLKAMSVRQTDLGGGQVRVDIDLAGESSGRVPGQTFGTMTVTAGSDANRPNPWSYTGTLLAKSGAVVRISGWGVGMRTGQGHQGRYRGAVCYSTDDPKLAEFNGMIAAVETEADPATMLLTGTTYEWK
jgi:hypothetical protein